MASRSALRTFILVAAAVTFFVPVITLGGFMPLAAQAQVAAALDPTSQPVICIDPGHPSEIGSGATGRHITEMKAAWLVALRLKADLEARGVRVVMTKQNESQFVTNKRRAEIANECHAAYMVRLHCDANAGSGIAAYVPDRQGTVDGVRGPSESVIRLSQQLAPVFFQAVTAEVKDALLDRGLHSDRSTAVGAKHGALIGSIYSTVPVILVEMCVITNPHDESFIASPAGQQRLAKAMTDGIIAVLSAERAASANHIGEGDQR